MPGIVKYHDIKELIEAEITAGRFPPGSQLPSEPKLAEMYRASRGTIREALRNLEQEAVIARRSGIGTIVLRQPKSAQIMSFTEQVRVAGMEPSTEVLAAEVIIASAAGGRVREAFLLDDARAARTPVLRIERVRCGDRAPLACQTVYLLESDFRAGLLEEVDLTQSLFQIYARYHRQVTWADEIIAARLPNAIDAEVLRLAEHPLPEAQPFIYSRERISYDRDNQPLEVLSSIDRSDFFHGYRYRVLEDQPFFAVGGS